MDLVDAGVLEDVSGFTANDVHDCLSLLESLFVTDWDTSLATLERTLIISISLLRRAKAIENDFKGLSVHDINPNLVCDNGFSDMISQHVTSRLAAIGRKNCEALGDVDALRNSILSMKLLKDVIAQCFGFDSARDLGSFDFVQLRNMLINIH